MKTVLKLLIVGCFCFLTFAGASAAEWYYIGSNVWNEAKYFVYSDKTPTITPEQNDNTVLPGADDRVTVMPNRTVYITDANLGQLAAFKGISTHHSGITVDVKLESDGTLGCFLGDLANWGTRSAVLVKTGVGKLTFGRTGGAYLDSTWYDYGYRISVDVREGAVQLAPSSGSNYKYIYNDITVASGATLYGVTSGTTLVDSIAGAGTITNLVKSGTVLETRGARVEPTVFSGLLAGFGRFNPKGHTYLTGTANTIGSTFAPGGYTGDGTVGITGFMTMGPASTPSSVGSASYIYSGAHRYVYLGSAGWTVNMLMRLSSSTTTAPTTLDGGPCGGLLWTGAIDTDSAWHQRIRLSGDNVQPCVLSNAIANVDSSSRPCAFRLSKDGSGTWRVYDRPDNRLSGVVAIEQGTLEVDSLRGAGYRSALGSATDLYGDVSGNLSAQTKVPYAHVLGSAAGGIGTLSYLGTAPRVITDRPIALAGAGRLVATNCAALKWKGVSGLTAGEKSLAFYCGANQTNMLSDVTDGAGKVSVIKEGPGDLELTGDLSFRGDLVATGGGTLTVRKTSGENYSWYRLTIRETAASSTDPEIVAKVGTSGTRIAYLNEFALYNASGTRQNRPWRSAAAWSDAVTNDVATLAPERVALDYQDDITIYKFSNGYGSPWRICADDHSGAVVTALRRPNTYVKPDDPSSWLSLVVRLNDASTPITSYDLNFYAPSSNYEFGGQPTAWTVEGSADGLNWESLATTNNAAFLPSAYYSWVSDGTAFVANSTRQGLALAQTSVQANNSLLGNVRSVSAAAGTTLRVLGGTVSVGGLKADAAAGIGAFEGFAFASSGTINLVNVDPCAREFTLGGTFTKSTGAASLANWSVKLDGQPTAKYDVTMTEAGLTFRKKGFMLMLR